MIETKLTDLLEHTADQTPVGPPPLAALRAGAVRRRRRRTAGLAAVAVVAVGAVIVGSNLLTPPTRTGPVTSPTPAPPPPAMRLVGFGHAVIAIPADWPTNKSSCGTPQQDTVQIDDPTAANLCMINRPVGVDSVQLTGAPPSLDYHADETIVIDGVQAQRQRTSCLDGWQEARVCSGAVSIPALKVWFRTESSTGAAEVDRMLARVQITPERSGVPSYRSLARTVQGTLAADYAVVLRQDGLKARYRTERSPSYPRGLILGVSPAPGTMLASGSTVTVTVVG
jgi:PASTA domain